MRSRFNGSKRVKSISSFKQFIIKLNNLDKVLIFKFGLSFVLLIILIFLAIFTYSNYKARNTFEQSVLEFANLNEDVLFTAEEFYLYSSANIENSNLLQYTDISFKINNIKNVKVSELFINDINFFETPEIGNQTLMYKNPLEFGKYGSVTTQEDVINFNVLNSNTDIDYSKPYALNNLANPITLEYMNSNIKENFSTYATSLTYDGTLLKNANINLQDLNCSFSFHINIILENGNTYICKVIIDVPLKQEDKSIFDGSVLVNDTVNVYPFYRVK